MPRIIETQTGTSKKQTETTKRSEENSNLLPSPPSMTQHEEMALIISEIPRVRSAEQEAVHIPDWKERYKNPLGILCDVCGQPGLLGTSQCPYCGRRVALAQPPNFIDKKLNMKPTHSECFDKNYSCCGTCAAFIKNRLAEKQAKEKQTVQIILDFSSLKDALSKDGGLVLRTYKCPHCSGNLDIPESGKMLICRYCGTQIKPIDIFEKIRSLM